VTGPVGAADMGALVLGLTTATPRGSVALLRGGRLLASCCYEDEMRHAERLFDTIDQVLADAQLARRHLTAIACDVGPGSFTGVRVGVASAKGMALALGLPLLPVQSLEAMAMAAFQAVGRDIGQVVCAVDAKRRETFFAVYDRQLKACRGPAHVVSAEIQAALGDLAADRAVAFCGRASRQLALPSARLVDRPICELPHAEWVARRALALLGAELPPLAEVEPVYLRAPDAVPNLPKPLIG
jgi:tRNA threonylcarbamoyladenosine biosynthesis protein TsaB